MSGSSPEVSKVNALSAGNSKSWSCQANPKNGEINIHKDGEAWSGGKEVELISMRLNVHISK